MLKHKIKKNLIEKSFPYWKLTNDGYMVLIKPNLNEYGNIISYTLNRFNYDLK